MKLKCLLLSFFSAVLILSSCKTSNDVVSNGILQKRKYRPGFHLNVRHAERNEVAKALIETNHLPSPFLLAPDQETPSKLKPDEQLIYTTDTTNLQSNIAPQPSSKKQIKKQQETGRFLKSLLPLKKRAFKIAKKSNSGTSEDGKLSQDEILAIVFTSIALVFLTLPVLGLLFAILGLVFSRRAEQSKPSQLAQVLKIISIVFTILGVLYLLFYVAYILFVLLLFW